MIKNFKNEKKLGDVIELSPSAPKLDDSTDVTFLGMADVSEDGRIIKNESKKYSNVRSGFTSFKNNDVLVAKITPCFENGKGALVKNLINGYGFGSTEFHVLRPSDKIDPYYLLSITQSHPFRMLGETEMTGSAGQKRVPAEFIRSYKIYLPPLAEQKKIAAILRTWDEAIENVQSLIAAKENELEWRCAQTIIFFKEKIGLKETQIKDFLGKEIIIEKGKPIKGTDVAEGNIPIIAGGKTSPYAHNEQTHTIPCITISASGAYAGYIWYHQAPIWASDCNVIYSLTGVTKYLYYALKSQQHKVYTLQSGGAQPHVYARDIQSLKIVLPDAGIQKKIVELLDTAEREIFLLKKKLSNLQNQKRGLMQKLLTGAWSVQADSSEESSSKKEKKHA